MSNIIRQYWQTRYDRGGNSGAGSYGRLAEFKAEVINTFLTRHNLESVVELGCGDGHQLGLFNVKKYLGFDICQAAVDICSGKYDGTGKEFHLYEPDSFESDFKLPLAEVALSLDVIFHQVDDDIFQDYMSHLFKSSSRYVIIYSKNVASPDDLKNLPTANHLRYHDFVGWIKGHVADFVPCGHIPNRYPYEKTNYNETSFCDFYFYKKITDNE